jgi:hypothetical protein
VHLVQTWVETHRKANADVAFSPDVSVYQQATLVKMRMVTPDFRGGSDYNTWTSFARSRSDTFSAMPTLPNLVIVPVITAIGLAALARLWPQVRGTTLVAPVIWTAIALVAVAVVEMSLAMTFTGGRLPSWAAFARHCAAVATLCPSMALLGAKRPQDRAWQFIVLAMWLVLCLPSLRSWLFGGGAVEEIHPAQGLFLTVLIAMAVLNYLPTRLAVPSILFACSQLLLHRTAIVEYLHATSWPGTQTLVQYQSTVGLGCGVAAILLVMLQWPSRHTASQPIDRVWLDFRDAFGTVWALRIAQRVNQSATLYGWAPRLGWYGFTPPREEAILPAEEKAINDNFKSLLRRFVSAEWIAKRLESTDHPLPAASSVV